MWQLAKLSSDGGERPVLLDITELLGGIGDAYNRRTLKAFGVSAPNGAFSAILQNSGFEVLGMGRFANAPQPEMSADAREGIRETTRSALISYARDPLPDTSKLMWRNLEKALISGAERTFASVSAVLLARPDITSVYVLNGRFPHQRAVLEAAKSLDRRIVHYEKGEKPDTYWLSDHSTLDRVATQSSVDSVLAHLTEEESIELGKTWMNRRSKGGNSANIYSRFFHDESKADYGQTAQKVVGLFTSSQDEFAALGPEWHVQEWGDQWEAFDAVLSHLSQFDFSFYLRVHPNFATKSHASFFREKAHIEKLQGRHPALKVIWHDEQVNSYTLLNQTDVVVVWDSTIGLEASGRGLPVWELAASYFDLYADVREWFGPAIKPSREEIEFAVDTDRAHRFMAYLELREPQLSKEAVDVRATLFPKVGVGLRIANVVSTGGAPTIMIGLASILDAMRHRRFAINRIAVRKALSR
ncbi:MAG TPA: hypothetical protein PJ998_04670 [Terrimesophilobacter sp.]|nr:hypothetical protein [Terrimesophilobacter sp.]